MRHTIQLLTLLSVSLMIVPNAVSQEAESVRFGMVRTLRTTALRNKPATTATRTSSLAPGLRLRWIEGQSKNGFIRVMTTRGQQGWIRATTAEVESRPPVLLAAAPPCAQTLDSCPENGCSQPGSKHALFNETKRRIPTESVPVALTFADFESLQEQANDLVDQGLDLSAADRAKLTNLHVSQGTVHEGSLVRLVGFIAKGLDPHPNTGESVNCRRTEVPSNDFHISFARRSVLDEFDGIVVEMIPQDRPINWTISRLKNLKQQQRKLMVVGAIFYDNAHVVNSDRDNPISHQPKRFSLWEIHPITQFFVCKKTNNQCNPNTASDWKRLEDQ